MKGKLKRNMLIKGKKINLDVIKKLIIGTMVGIIIITAMIITTQCHKIDNLENQLTIKQESREREFDYSETVALKNTIETRFNTEQDYTIMKNKVSIKHKYVLDEEAFLGLHRKETITGTATCYYQYVVPLSKAKVTISNNMKKVIIELPDPVLDEDTTHRVDGTFIMMEDECSSSLLSNKETTKKAMRYWEDSFDGSANKKIKSLHNKKDLKKYAKREVKELIDTLGYDDLNIEVVVK